FECHAYLIRPRSFPTRRSSDLKAAINAADEQMWKNGIVAVGDISNNSDSFKAKADSEIYYHTFVELIGLNPKNADLIFGKGKELDRKSTRLNSSHVKISYAVFC